MKNSPNKMISSEDIREYHFAGNGVRPPTTVTAKSQAEAVEIYNSAPEVKSEESVKPQTSLPK